MPEPTSDQPTVVALDVKRDVLYELRVAGSGPPRRLQVFDHVPAWKDGKPVGQPIFEVTMDAEKLPGSRIIIISD